MRICRAIACHMSGFGFQLKLPELFNWQTLLLKTRVRMNTINSSYTEQFKMGHTHFLSHIHRTNNLQSRGSAYLPREVQKCWWASRVFWQRLLRVSQTRRLLSSLALTINLPPGWNTTPRTQLSWPTNVKRHMPVPTSQTCRTIKISNKICNKNNHLLPLVGILFPNSNDKNFISKNLSHLCQYSSYKIWHKDISYTDTPHEKFVKFRIK